MKISEIEYKAIKTARIFKAGPETNEIKQIWIGLHGYGQLPLYFIKKLLPLVDDKTLVMCPEGLSKFYLQGTSGRIGASWMTKDNRLTEIEDYSNYMQGFLERLQHQYKQASIFILGFSQGGATAIRWLESKKPEISGLILWSAMFPEDISYHMSEEYFRSFPLVHVYGNQDPYYGESISEVPGQPLCITHVFNGGHDIPAEDILKVRDIINKIYESE